MRAGCLRHSLDIKSKTLVDDGMGGSTETWTTVFIVWGSVWPVSAKERIQNQQLEHEITHNIRIRYLSGVVSSMRVVFNSRIFEILSIVNFAERNITLDLVCREIT